MDTLDDLPPGIGQYDDFHTIDWLRDIARDRMRHRQVIKKRQDSCLDYLKGAHDAWSGWVCVFLVGVATGRVSVVFSSPERNQAYRMAMIRRPSSVRRPSVVRPQFQRSSPLKPLGQSKPNFI